MGFIVLSGHVTADLGSQDASDNPYLSHKAGIFQPCLYFWRAIPATM